ncbi:Pno1 protein [Saccharomycopsis crataegensis]|uniref:Pre-rRNA-processing protein PNO1 n=1 Tax=Saccharomycopsis crataegensis TaxID=43959 RepID=A0AAV5QSZ4_9ASCO|nr:Pno1 protein [Saccharomycopsis crataegensis]
MSAPTAIQEDKIVPDTTASTSGVQKVIVDDEGKPRFAAQSKTGSSSSKSLYRKVQISQHRFTPFKNNWVKIYPPLIDHLHLQVKLNPSKRTVDMRTHSKTPDPQTSLQKAVDFLTAFNYGFELNDCISLIKLDDLYIQTFEVKDVKTLTGQHLSRAIGRIAGKDGKTKFSIENSTKTRIVLADSKIHILGTFTNINMAKQFVVSLILGTPQNKIYNNLRVVSSRMKERY